MEKAIDKVKRKLWTFGYSVQDVSNVPGIGFDLLVDHKYRVKIAKKGDALDSLIGGEVIIAVVGRTIKYNICDKKKCWEEVSPLKAFPKVEA